MEHAEASLRGRHHDEGTPGARCLRGSSRFNLRLAAASGLREQVAGNELMPGYQSCLPATPLEERNRLAAAIHKTARALHLVAQFVPLSVCLRQLHSSGPLIHPSAIICPASAAPSSLRAPD